jgi:hypothetical protein
MSFTSSKSIHRIRDSFSAEIIALTELVTTEKLTPCEHVLAFLHEIDKRFPGLSYRDFVVACTLAEMFERETGGHA